MKEHTFQKGDRVVCSQWGRGTVRGVNTYGHILIQRDDGQKGSGVKGYWSTTPEYLEYDRAFKVGDWVRLEVPDENHFVPESIEGAYQFIGHKNERVSRICAGESMLNIATAFLVKIAPPQEEPVNSIIIEHPEHGRVEGVTRGSLGIDWGKNGACYFKYDDWNEVNTKKWVRYASQAFVNSDRQWRNLKVWFEEDMHATVFTLPPGYRWKTVEIEKAVWDGELFSHYEPCDCQLREEA